MGDSEEKAQPDVPAWQKAPPHDSQTTATATEPPATLEQARKFLQDPHVLKESTERKQEFLRGKGISQSDIDVLLKEVAQEAQADPPVTPTAALEEKQSQTTEPSVKPDASPLESAASRSFDRPPIVTYPEFLTKPVRPPPLMTMNGFLNTLYAFGGLSTLVYGTSKYVLEPMVQSLTEARISLHETAHDDLTKLVEKLETVVSELPPSIKKDHAVEGEAYRDDDEKSSYDDPSELFHRDVGVQTSLPPSPTLAIATPSQTEPASATQARRLAQLVDRVKDISEGLTDQTESLGDVKTVLDVLTSDLSVLSSAQAGSDYGGGFSVYGSRNEPDDEIKKAKENIRRVKGVLLSTRSFPASTR
ncbi:hypothetical protein OQA88_11322 [Cercophora sp. LCS_1]